MPFTAVVIKASWKLRLQENVAQAINALFTTDKTEEDTETSSCIWKSVFILLLLHHLFFHASFSTTVVIYFFEIHDIFNYVFYSQFENVHKTRWK